MMSNRRPKILKQFCARQSGKEKATGNALQTESNCEKLESQTVADQQKNDPLIPRINHYAAFQKAPYKPPSLRRYRSPDSAL